MKRLLLLGGGHSHALVLLAWAQRPLPGVELCLVSPAQHSLYSGLVPAWLAGRIPAEALQIDLAALCRAAGKKLERWQAMQLVDTKEKGLVPANLEMKKGAQVVIVANDSERKYVNGSVGVVEKLEENSIHVRLESGDIIELKPKIWENHSYHFNRHEKRIVSVVEGTYIQFPIKPAWAITIHKSQGLTLMKVNIDLGRGAFCSGQTYVALSRCTTLEGIRLAVPIRPRDIMVNPHVSTYYKGQHVVARHTVEDLARFFA